jgi:DNA-binding NarL/FixJ family response regulator
MINVALIGTDMSKEQALLSNVPDVRLSSIPLSDFDTMLNQVAHQHPDIVVLSDIRNSLDVDDFCMHIYLRTPEIKTLIVTETEFDYKRLEKTGFSCKGFMPYEQRHAIARAVKVIHEGESWLSRKLVTELLDHLSTGALADYRTLKLVTKK